MQKKWGWFFAILLFFFLSHAVADSGLNSETRKTFIALSDIHFDPFVGCEALNEPCKIALELNQSNYKAWKAIFEKFKNTTMVRIYQETDYVLFESLLSYLKILSHEKNPDFVLIPGDFITHHFRKKYKKWTHDASLSGYEAFLKKTMQFLVSEINVVFPTIDVFPAVGNNDSYTGNYSVVPEGKFFKDMEMVWAPFIKDNTNKKLFQKTFYKVGYYSAELKNANYRLIVLNTVLYMPIKQDKKIKLCSDEQLIWMRKELLIAKQNHQKVILLFHIPPSIETPFLTIKSFWDASDRQQFFSDIKEFSYLITAMVAGHIHIDLIQQGYFWKNRFNPQMITVPSISPIYGNNPAFKLFYFDGSTRDLESVDTFYYSFTRSYFNKKAQN